MQACEEAAKTWEIQKLFADLEARQRRLNPDSKGPSDFEKQCLCLLLAGKSQDEIAEYLQTTVGTLRVKWSRGKGLYYWIKKLTGRQIDDWRDVILLLLNKGYRKAEEPREKEETMLFMTCDVEVSEEILRQLEEKVRQITGSRSLSIVRIDKGSIVLVWQGSREACDRLDALFREGQLSDLLGVPVLDVLLAAGEEPINRLSQWFENIFETGWRSAEELLSPQQLNPVWSVSVKRAKQIDLKIDLITHAVVLVVTLRQESDEKVNVWPQVYPTGEDTYLPPNIQLLVLTEDGEVFQEVTARSADSFIQCQFDADLGDQFRIQVVLGEARVTEKFVI